jgi:hypothetical protein
VTVFSLPGKPGKIGMELCIRIGKSKSWHTPVISAIYKEEKGQSPSHLRSAQGKKHETLPEKHSNSTLFGDLLLVFLNKHCSKIIKFKN